MSTSAIHLDLDELALKGGERYERTWPLDLEPILLGGQRCEVLAPDGVTATVDRVAGGYLVTVGLKATIYGACDRCLKEATVDIDAEEQEFVPTSKEGWDEADLSPFIDDMTVDVSGIAREATVLALPNQVVCSEDCQGLCPLCGQDLNSGECSCDRAPVDGRLEVLRDIKFDE